MRLTKISLPVLFALSAYIPSGPHHFTLQAPGGGAPLYLYPQGQVFTSFLN